MSETTKNTEHGSDCHERLVRHLDLFSGIGGFALAAQMAGGFETVGFCEIDPWARRVLAKNFPTTPIHDDVKTLKGTEYGTIDIITGGYPCQPFSHAGKRLGEEDARHLWPEMRRIIAQARPRWVLAENVAGHVNLGLDQVLADLEALGYSASATIIPACAVNAPHRRDRVWIIAYCHNAGSGASERKSYGNGATHSQERQQSQRGASRDNSHAANSTGERYARRESWHEAARQHIKRDRVGSKERHDWAKDWAEVATRVCRVDDGLPYRLDRLRGLGNAIVPQVAAEILRSILRVDSLTNAEVERGGLHDQNKTDGLPPSISPPC